MTLVPVRSYLVNVFVYSLSSQLFLKFINFKRIFRFLLRYTDNKMPKYAVAVGRKIGIYDTYDECQQQVKGFPNPKFKKFNTVKEAQEFIDEYSQVSNISALMRSKTSIQQEEVPKASFTKSQRSAILITQPPAPFKVNEAPIPRCSCDCSERLHNLEQYLKTNISSINDTLLLLKNHIINIDQSNVSDDERPAKRKRVEPDSKLKDEEETVGEMYDNNSFLRDNSGIVKVYTDGACSLNGRTGAKAGIGIWFNHDHPLNVSAPLKGPATNNNAEIQAARVAIHQALKAGIKDLCVFTDSKFLISCICDWIHKWKKTNWVLSTGGNVKNKDELVKLDAVIQRMHSVKWEHVSAHKGDEGNEMADTLARRGAAQYLRNVTYSSLNDSFSSSQ